MKNQNKGHQQNSIFKQYVSLCKRHQNPARIFSFSLLIIIIGGAFLLKPSYKASSSLVVRSEKLLSEWDILRNETEDTDFEEQALSRAVLEPVLKEFGIFPRTKSPEKQNFMEAFLEDLSKKIQSFFPAAERNKLAELNQAIKDFKKKIKAQRLKHSSILQVTAKTKSPQLSADYANTISRSFLKYMKTKQEKQMGRILGALNAQLEAVSKSLNTQAEIRNQFLKTHGWDDYLSDLQNTKAQVSALKNSLRFLESYERVKKTAPGTSPQATELGLGVSHDPSLEGLNRELVLADNRLSNVASRHTNENLGVLQARLEREWIDSIFKRQVENVQERRTRIEQQLKKEQGRLYNLMRWEPKARTLESELLHLEQRFQELLKQKSQLELSLNVLEHSTEDSYDRFQIMDEALPPLPESLWGYRLKLILMGIFLAMISFLITPLIFELMDFRFEAPKSPEPEIPADFYPEKPSKKVTEDTVSFSQTSKPSPYSLFVKGEENHDSF